MFFHVTRSFDKNCCIVGQFVFGTFLRELLELPQIYEKSRPKIGTIYIFQIVSDIDIESQDTLRPAAAVLGAAGLERSLPPTGALGSRLSCV